MRFRCPFCFLAVKTVPESCGYQIQCPNCHHQVTVPPGRFQNGCVIGDFLIKEKIGEGSNACVYLATQLSLERQVALKVLSPEFSTHAGIDQFLKEARAAAKLSHINLVQTYAVGKEDNFYYFAMTCIHGETITSRLKRKGKIPVDEALHIIQQAAEALCYAWEESHLVHKDIKPDNIMIAEDGIIKVTDLGLSIYAGEWDDGNEVAGSPAYMSPEQLTGKVLDTRTDIYSLGVTLYQMLSGKQPFTGKDFKDLAEQHLRNEPARLDKIDRSIPLKVALFVNKMLAKRPADRFDSMEELLRELWTLRQSTAPDKNIIPAVHTLTAARLNYASSLESAEVKKNVLKLENEVSIHKRYLKILLPLLPILIGAAISFTIYRYESAPPAEKSMERIALERIASFERFSKDPTLPLETVQSEGRKMISEFQKSDIRLRRAVMFRVRWLMADARVTRLNAEKKKLERRIDYLRNSGWQWDAFRTLFCHMAPHTPLQKVQEYIEEQKKLNPSPGYAAFLKRQYILYRNLVRFHERVEKDGKVPGFLRNDAKFFQALLAKKFALASTLKPEYPDLANIILIMRDYRIRELNNIRILQGRKEAEKKLKEILLQFEGDEEFTRIKQELEEAIK
ncbi:MAG: serine/threonine protein kinase [Lentisphaeria bacterium]|nr:serine/threonine protein kinase [Lentisphaeria bacterium]